MTEKIPFAHPYIGREEEEAVLRVLRSGWLTTGKESLAFEEEFGNFLKKGNIVKSDEGPFCMAVNSATSGLHLALEAAGIKEGDLVLLPSMTFTATAEVVRYLGAEVVFVDVIKDGFHMDPLALERTLERLSSGLCAYNNGNEGEGFGPKGNAKAIMPVHYGGLVREMEAILALSKKYKLKVIEDAAHSFPSFLPDKNKKESGHWAGDIGDAGVFSFYATKTISTGEGGMVITRNREIAERVKIMRSHGIDRSIWSRYTDNKASWYYEVLEPGFKYNIPDILSAIGRVQLERADDLLSMRQTIASAYDDAFSNDEHFSIPPTGDGDARHLYPLLLNLNKLTVSRNEFAAMIQEEGIGVSVHYIPLHIQPYYKKRYSLNEMDFEQTFKTYNRCLSLPIWPGMKEGQIEKIIRVVKNLAIKYNKNL